MLRVYWGLHGDDSHVSGIIVATFRSNLRPQSSTMMTEATGYTETSLYLHNFSWLHIPAGGNSFINNYKNNQQDALYRLIYYSKSALHVSGDVFAHHQKHLTVFTVSGSVQPSCCRHQPAATWVNNTRYCKYGQMLLMMGENIARNM